jgi:polysaccharide biosynthesis/export protein ExoF
LAARCRNHLVRLLGFAVGAWLLWTPVQAQPTPPRDANAAQSSKPSDTTTDLANAQSVRLRFSDFPNLTGEYRIGADSTIAIPAVGRLSVRGLNVRSFEELVGQKVGAASGRQTFVAVEILEYRPVFVTGQVNRPGPVAWQPRMTVLQAVASAGGIYRSPSTGGPTSANLRRAVDDQKRWLATYARVQAELSNVQEIEIPKRLLELVGENEAQKLIEQQSRILEQRRTTLESQLNILAENKRILGLELEALKEQRSKLQEQLRLRQDRHERIEQLYSKGLAVADAALQQRIELASLEERIANASVSIARIQTAAASAERDRANLINSRRIELQAELQNLDRSITQGEFDLPKTSVASARSSKPSSYGYTVARANDDDQADVAAAPSTELFPGDVLTVSDTLL